MREKGALAKPVQAGLALRTAEPRVCPASKGVLSNKMKEGGRVDCRLMSGAMRRDVQFNENTARPATLSRGVLFW